MDAYTTLLLTSSPQVIQHVLENGLVVDLPDSITLVCEVSNPSIASTLANVKVLLLDFIRLFGFLYTIRFSVQFFGNINPYDEGILQAIYDFTEPYTRLFLGFMPTLYNMDIGLLLGFIVLDRIETLISNIAILDLTGKIY